MGVTTSNENDNCILEVKSLDVKFVNRREELQVIKDLNFSVGEGRFVSLVGPSGCGKTTLLRCVSGLQRRHAGQILASGRNVIEPIKDMTLVFQEYNKSLYPWRTVLRNTVLPIEDTMNKKEAEELALGLLQDVGLKGFANYYPWQLSGGMQQRASIARALILRPKILLMDEPFASVDAQTRMVLEDQILRIWNEHKLTILFVTHDIDEAIYLSQSVVVLSARPAQVITQIPIDLGYPRDQVATRADGKFGQYRAVIHGNLGITRT